MKDFTDHVAFVTGGAGGLGREICRVLAAEKFHVIVADVRGGAVRTTCDELRAAGGLCSALTLDLTHAAELEDAVAAVLSEHQRLDVLINNAGIDLTVPVEEMPLEQWDRILAVNLRAPFILSKAALPIMRRQRRGDIINIVSTAALRAWPNASAYHASKWGLLGFSHALHTEARQSGVKVTALIAGGMKTPFLTERFPDIDLSLLQDPANVAQALLYLLNTPEGSVIPELKVLPMRESSWP